MSTDRSPKLAVSLTLDVSICKAKDVALWTCQDCASRLTMDQPDIQQPDRLLGTCSACGIWYAAYGMPDSEETVILRVPGLDELRALLARGFDHPSQKPRLAADAPIVG